MFSVNSNLPQPKQPKLTSHTVIKALKSHQAKSSREFSFEKDDCFYMVGGSSDAREYLEVIHPRSRTHGLVPANSFEFVHTTSLNKIPQLQRKNKNVLAYVTQNYYRIASYDLEASKGDPVLILDELCDAFYLAKLIGKVDTPGRIPRTHVELKDDISQRTASSLPPHLQSNPPHLLRKNNSTGNPTRADKGRNCPPRRTESTPVIQPRIQSCNPYSSWGILNAELKLGSLDISEDNSDVTSVVLDTIPISEIKMIKGLEYRGQVLTELRVKLCDSTTRTIFRKSSSFKKLQLSLLETFPKESGISGQNRTMPYMPTLDKRSINPSLSRSEVKDFDQFFCELLEVNAFLPRCRPLLDFITSQSLDSELAHLTTADHHSSPSDEKPLPSLQLNKLFRNPQMLPMKSYQDVSTDQPILPYRDSCSTFSSRTTATNSSFISSRTSSRVYSTKDLPSPPSAAPPSSTNIKIKLHHDSDIIAFMIPASQLTYSSLLSRISDRVGHDPTSITHYDPNSSSHRRRIISNQSDLDACLRKSKNKLYLTVE